MSRTDTAPRLVVPVPEELAPLEPFNPRIDHVSQEKALELVAELDQQRFNQMGTIEQYSGIHPTLGQVIILITSSSDSVVIPLS